MNPRSTVLYLFGLRQKGVPPLIYSLSTLFTWVSIQHLTNSFLERLANYSLTCLHSSSSFPLLSLLVSHHTGEQLWKKPSHFSSRDQFSVTTGMSTAVIPPSHPSGPSHQHQQVLKFLSHWEKTILSHATSTITLLILFLQFPSHTLSSLVLVHKIG